MRRDKETNLFILVIGAILFCCGYFVHDIILTIAGAICVLGAVYDL